MARMMAEVVNFPGCKNFSINPSMTDPPALLASAPNARDIIIELEHEIADLNQHIAFQSRTLGKFNPLRAKTRLLLAVLIAFVLGWAVDPPLGQVVARVIHPGTALAQGQPLQHGSHLVPREELRAWQAAPTIDI